MLLIVPFWGALLFTEAFSVKHYDDNSQDEHYEGSGRVRRSRGRGEDFGRERSDRTERSRPARIRTEAGTVVLAGFHAVAARLKLDPESIQQVYVDPERRDKRMREMREKLFAAGVRVMLMLRALTVCRPTFPIRALRRLPQNARTRLILLICSIRSQTARCCLFWTASRIRAISAPVCVRLMLPACRP